MAKHEFFRVFGDKVKKAKEMMEAGKSLKFEVKSVEGREVGVFYLEDED